MKKAHLNKLFNVFTWVLFGLILWLIITSIFYPAYLSYVNICKPTTFDKINELLAKQDNTLIVVGMMSAKGEEEEDKREVEEEDLPNIVINIHAINEVLLKHEIIHLNQLFRNVKLLQCSYPVLKYFSEVEAYTFQWLPGFLYKGIYETNIEEFIVQGVEIKCEMCEKI